MAKKFICIGEPYTAANGEEKMSFKRIGEIFTGKNGKEYAKLYTIPGQLLHVFVDEPQPKKDEGDF
jgi:hypothetical protein